MITIKTTYTTSDPIKISSGHPILILGDNFLDIFTLPPRHIYMHTYSCISIRHTSIEVLLHNNALRFSALYAVLFLHA